MGLGGSVDVMTGEVSAVIKPTRSLSTSSRDLRHRRIPSLTMAQSAKELDLKRFDGAGRRCIDWDGLRRVCLKSLRNCTLF